VFPRPFDFSANRELFAYYAGSSKSKSGLKWYLNEISKQISKNLIEFSEYDLRKHTEELSIEKTKTSNNKRPRCPQDFQKEPEVVEHRASTIQKLDKHSPSVNNANNANVKIQKASVSKIGSKQPRFYQSPSFAVAKENYDIDSDFEADDSWQLNQNLKMIDDFNDISHGEKELMKIWNEFVYKYPISADFRVCDHALLFCTLRKNDIKRGRLRSTVLLHFMSLWEFGIIESEDIEKAMNILDS
jgi:hypothetical protein